MTAIEQSVSYDVSSQQLICGGNWNLANIPSIQAILEKITWPATGNITVDGSKIDRMDSAGAWLLDGISHTLTTRGLTVSWSHFSSEHSELISIIQSTLKQKTELPVIKKLTSLEFIGKSSLNYLAELMIYLSFIGKLSLETLRIFRHPKHFRIASIASTIYQNGFQALPIIALLSFMIGVVITFQMGLQLKTYGANIFIVDLLGMSILREFGPLLTAIMVAGRSGSAYTAQLGMMKINQEIDALDTMGVTPAELLLIPRIIGLVIALPLITMWADIFGVFGGMIMSNNMLSVSWYDFLHRFPTVIPLRAFIIGIGKTPIFALIIASIGCFQGMQVEENADSVGRNTTRSVVLSIFIIIVADAIFSIIFSKLKL